MLKSKIPLPAELTSTPVPPVPTTPGITLLGVIEHVPAVIQTAMALYSLYSWLSGPSESTLAPAPTAPAPAPSPAAAPMPKEDYRRWGVICGSITKESNPQAFFLCENVRVTMAEWLAKDTAAASTAPKPR